MPIKVDIEKLKSRIEKRQSATSENSYSEGIKKFLISEKQPGSILFRAFPYPHNEDPSSEPFFEKWYHFGLPGGAFFCPKQNKGDDCLVCEYAWEKMKENKGNADAVKEYREFLPKLVCMVPGIIRDREDEGPKFFRVSVANMERPTKAYSDLYSFFTDEDTQNWLDDKEGFDLKLHYSAAPEGKKKFLKGASVVFENLELARRPSKFGTKVSMDQAIEKTPNILAQFWPEKTTEDSEKILTSLRERMKKQVSSTDTKTEEKLNEKSAEVHVSSDAPRPVAVSVSDVRDKLAALGISD